MRWYHRGNRARFARIEGEMMDYLFIDLAALLGLWAIPMIWLYAAGFRYILKLAKENEELREINEVLHVKIASYEKHKPVEQQERPEWVRYLMDGTDPRMEARQ